MPEQQNVHGDYWNRRLNRFLGDILKWKQLGESNNDVYCEDLKRKIGLDSVFAYKRNEQSAQQVVFVEAKTVEKLDNISRVKIENWVHTFFEKIAHAPQSKEFHEKFQPQSDALFDIGMIGLWVRNTDGYTEEKLQAWLSQVNLPTRRQNPINIFFAPNHIIAPICSIHQTIQSLTNQKGYESVRPYFPAYSNFPVADGAAFPIESLFSKFIIYKTQKRQVLKNKSSRGYELYDSWIVFFSGNIENYSDLRFIGLALRQFQITRSEIEIYILKSPTELRNEIKNFESEFSSETDNTFTFHEMNPSNNLPGWLE